jgi:hypothetical protein
MGDRHRLGKRVSLSVRRAALSPVAGVSGRGKALRSSQASLANQELPKRGLNNGGK